MVNVTDLRLEGNVRTVACEAVPQMVSSLRRNGFKPNHPPVVSERTDGTYVILCGNRRTKGLFWLRDNDAAEYSRIVPNGKIPCVVHKGLTEEEEILLRIDHSSDEDRVALDDWSEFTAIKQLVRAFTGESQERIAEKLGIFHTKGKNAGKPNRSYVQTRVNLARLPEYVQEQFRLLLTEGKDSTKVRITDIKSLYEAYNAEFADYPDGNGPKFGTVWNGIVNPEPKADSDDSSGRAKEDPASLKPEQARQRAQGAASRIMKRILLAATNQGGSLVELDAQVASMETDSLILADVRAYLGDAEFATLVGKAQQARLEREAQKIESAAVNG
jgi:hypothetical protein